MPGRSKPNGGGPDERFSRSSSSGLRVFVSSWLHFRVAAVAVVRTFRSARHGRPEGLHYKRLLHFTPVLAAAFGIALSAQTPASNWPQFRGNARLTGVAPTAPPDTLKLKWTYEAGESIESSPAVADGTVYVGS